MNKLYLFRQEFKQGYFEKCLRDLGINKKIWPKISMVMIYLTNSTFEVYDKDGNSIKQKL